MNKLDITKPQQVTYCIPTWARDLQIEQAIKRVKGRIQPGQRKGSVAIVGFGPSLNQTWKKIKDFDYVISTSGAHQFLISKGIVPDWHVAVDPQPGNTVKLIGKPHKDVEYLIASTCHNDVFDHLEGYNVKLWHVFDPSEGGQRLLPPGEWALTGGCDVGLRAIAIAGFLGFKDLHVFGMDGSAPNKGAARHAGEHPDKRRIYSVTEFNNKKYYTTPAMLEAARQLWHELDQLPAVKVRFYGKGLIQDMAKKYVQKKTKPTELTNAVGFTRPELISDKYRKLNEKLHQDNVAYGVGGAKHAPVIFKLAQSLQTTSVLDYGCGKGFLAKKLPFPIWEYDPAIEGKTATPRPADIVVCTDVLEHIEPDKIDFVLADILRCMKKVGYFTIHTGPANKKLADGRNTHLIQKNQDWWEKKLKKFFEVGKFFKAGPELVVVVGPLTKLQKPVLIQVKAKKKDAKRVHRVRSKTTRRRASSR